MQSSFSLEKNPTGVIDSNSSEVTISFSYEKIISEKTKWYRCTHPGCSKTFRYKSEIVRHVITHSDEKSHFCPFEGCHKAFKRLDNLKAHIHFHKGEKPFICEFPGCDFRCTSRSSLYYHSRKHANAKTYACKFPGCNKAFLTKAHLKQHEKATSYHKQLNYKEQTFDEAETKKILIVEKGRNQILETHLAPESNSLKINESKDSFLNAIKGTENLNSVLDKLRKENELLKKSLEMHYEFQNYIKKANGSWFLEEPEEDTTSSIFFEKNTLSEEQEIRFLNFLKESVHNPSQSQTYF